VPNDGVRAPLLFADLPEKQSALKSGAFFILFIVVFLNSVTIKKTVYTVLK
jgi:hypothetical protein